MSCRGVNCARLLVPGDEDGDDPYSCRVWLYSLCEEGWSSTGAWLCHRQAAAGWPKQSAAGTECQANAVYTSLPCMYSRISKILATKVSFLCHFFFLSLHFKLGHALQLPATSWTFSKCTRLTLFVTSHFIKLSHQWSRKLRLPTKMIAQLSEGNKCWHKHLSEANVTKSGGRI